MGRDARDTREKLIRAGERLFARRGVDGALTRDIVAEAGQANGSAVHYHFGSRQGLLLAIADKHIGRMEPARADHLARIAQDGLSEELAVVVTGLVQPTAAELGTEDGRDFLRITAQLAGYAGFRVGETPAPVAGTALERQLHLLEGCCRTRLPEPVALERMATIVGLLTATLADRARNIDEGGPILLDHATFVDNLTLMIVAAIGAPVPAGEPVRPG